MRDLRLTPGVIRVVFSAGSAGSLVAALSAHRISRRLGIGATTIAAAALWGPAFLLIALAPAGYEALPFLTASGILVGFTAVVYGIVQVSYRQAICPPRLQGRMNSVMRFMVWGTIPLGTLLGGVLATWIGLRETILVAAIGGGLVFLFIVFSPQRHLREMPEPVVEIEAAGAAGDAAPEPAGA